MRCDFFIIRVWLFNKQAAVAEKSDFLINYESLAVVRVVYLLMMCTFLNHSKLE